MIDFAQRAHDHNFKLDPIVRSRLDTDFYKPLMQQFNLRRNPNVDVEFRFKNRSDVPLANFVSIEEIKEQFDHARTVMYQPTELVILQGQRFSGLDGIFGKDYIDFLRTSKLPEYHIEHERAYNGTVGYNTGNYDIRFPGRWVKSTDWELHCLTVISELYARSLLKEHDKSELVRLYDRAKVKLYDKLEALAAPELEGISVSDFGTRRRHSYLWQRFVVQTMKEILGDRFGGTSNVHLATELNVEARGTNAHELPMVYSALASDDEELKAAPYKLCAEWQEDHPQALRIMLPDTFGTTGFLKDAPTWMADWAGGRPDSKKAIDGVQEYVDFYKAHGRDPATKLAIPSDGLDVHLPHHKPHGEDIPTIFKHFRGVIRQSFGWGTLATNDFYGCSPKGHDFMKPLSLVCKAYSANGRPCVKLSDNYNKATGPADEVARYRRVFGNDGLNGAPIIV